jgi:hypothetical protein
MNSRSTIIAIIATLSAALALADDFKTTNGKEYKNATVSRVEPDGITVKFSGGLVKIPFPELSKELQEKYHYDPEKAASAYTIQAAAVQQANQQAEELNKQRKDAYQGQLRQQANVRNVRALENAYQGLLQQEENLLAQIGRVQNAQEIARRKYINGHYTSDSHLTDASEANIPLLEGQLQNVREDKKRIREELDQAKAEAR